LSEKPIFSDGSGSVAGGLLEPLGKKQIHKLIDGTAVGPWHNSCLRGHSCPQKCFAEAPSNAWLRIKSKNGSVDPGKEVRGRVPKLKT